MKKKRNKNVLTVIIVAIMGFGLLGFNSLATFFGSGGSQGTPPTPTGSVPCINESLPIPDALHIHPQLRIIIDGANITIPANIGITAGCERVLHTHDDSGTIHVEPNFAHDYTLGDFFGVWGEPLSRTQVMSSYVDANHTLTMTVDGIPSQAFENLVLQDKQNIVLTYATVK